MLQPSAYETLPLKVSRQINSLSNWTIQDIARRINAAQKITATADYQLYRLHDIKEFDEAFKSELAIATGSTISEIEALFIEAAKEAHAWDKAIYEAQGVTFVPYERNPLLQQMVRAQAAQTRGTFENLTRTTGFRNAKGEFMQPREYFTRTLDNVTTQVSQGVRTYDEAIKSAVKEMVDSGLRSVDYESGRTDKLEVAVRRAVLTGIHQLAGQVTWNNIDQLGCTLVETSAHATARPEHQVWQGKRFALNGSVSEILAKVDGIRGG